MTTRQDDKINVGLLKIQLSANMQIMHHRKIAHAIADNDNDW